MTGNLWVDWGVVALSLANTILLMWLGTTVLLNTQRRTWGGWVAAAGLLLGGTFFVSHTAILGYGFDVTSTGLSLWWAVGLAAVTVLPFFWYVMMLWYSGFWQKPDKGEGNRLVRRHRLLLVFAGLLVIGLFVIALLTPISPSSAAYPVRGLEESLSVNGVPLILVFYPVYVIVCLLFSLDALFNPGPAHRRMAEIARQRARPWLIGASVMLLLVSLAVGGVFYWLNQFSGDFGEVETHLDVIGLFDLGIEAMITLAILMLGQAVVAYEIFTGQTLPRRGFVRQWQRAVLLAAGYGVVIGFTFSTSLRPIYGVLLSALLMTFFFSLLSWRTVSERQRTITSLRPFVASQRFYDQLLASTGDIDPDISLQIPFEALCQNVLNAQGAYLVALGPLAPLVGPPLSFPAPADGEVLQALPGVLAPIAGKMTQDTPIVRVRNLEFAGVEWAVPLWSQRGLVGMLLLGEKGDQGVYSREEIEVAQASGERLVDTKASVEIAQRLMALQRQRLTETQVADQRARRVLHDEILQQVHTAMLVLDRASRMDSSPVEEALGIMTEVHADISRLLRSLPRPSIPAFAEQGLIGALKVLVNEEFSAAFDEVRWQIAPDLDQKAASLPPLQAEVLYYAAREAIRNAARHGREGDESKRLCLTISLENSAGLGLTIEDDGIGLPANRESAIEGGQGLALHSTMMAVVGGSLTVESEPGEYTRVLLRLP